MSIHVSQLRNTVVPGDCVVEMRRMGSASVNFILTDPPYLCRYRSRDGQSIANDQEDNQVLTFGLKPYPRDKKY